MKQKHTRIRVYEIARDIGIRNQDLIERLRSRGLQVKSHMSTVDAELAEQLKSALSARGDTRPASGAQRDTRTARAGGDARPAGDSTRADSRAESRADSRADFRSGGGRVPASVVRRRKRAASRTEIPRKPGQEQAREQSREQSEVRPGREGDAGSVRPEFLGPRERFELELARARARTEEREQQQAKETDHTAPERAPDRGRPAVGTVIDLPARPRRGQGRVVVRSQESGSSATPSRSKGRRSGRPRRVARKRTTLERPAEQTRVTTPAEHKRVIKVQDSVTVAELARSMGVKATEMLRKLWGMGMVGININATLDVDTASLIASEYGYEVRDTAFRAEDALDVAPDRPEDRAPRAPVVTVMGHVDHGKTTLLDAIRKTRVAAGEAGGITQHIAAYRVAAPHVGDVVFLDTPGHEAFTAMRARGARVTDVVVLLVAATDGVMPQTVEAVSHARDAGVPIVVAVNKCDAPNAQPERVRSQLAEHRLIPEEWGGDTLYVDISALRGEGIDDLLEAIGLQAELLELRAGVDKPATGVVLESRLDRARGPVATVLVKEGTLRRGDTVVSGEFMGRVRAMFDDRGHGIDRAGPSTPVEILGLSGAPEAGEVFHATDEATARKVVEARAEERRRRQHAAKSKRSLEEFMERMRAGEVRKLKIVLKADVHGSVEALRQALSNLSTDEVGVDVIRAGVGGITESDVNLAIAGEAVIVGFRVRPTGKSTQLAHQHGVAIHSFDVIYDAVDAIRAAVQGLAPSKEPEEHLAGTLEVREIFRIPKLGTVAGCYVTKGHVRRRSHVRVFRDGAQVFDGKVRTLRRFTEDVTEVGTGYECGVLLDGFDDVQRGDVIEVWEQPAA